MHWWDTQLKEYQALPAWKDFPALWEAVIAQGGGRAQDYPFWLLTARSMQYAWGANAGNQLMHEVADNVAGHRGVIINAGAAARLGIADGDPIEIATPQRQVCGRAVVRQGLRPDTLLLIGQFDHWVTPLAKDFGMASMNSLAAMSMELTDATGSRRHRAREDRARERRPRPRGRTSRSTAMTRWAMVADLRRCVAVHAEDEFVHLFLVARFFEHLGRLLHFIRHQDLHSRIPEIAV